MRFGAALLCLLSLNAGGILFAQTRAADANARYYRIICLVHLTGSGKASDPILPEYVAQGTAVAQAALTVAVAASPVQAGGSGSAGTTAGAGVVAHAATAQPVSGPATAPTAVSATAPPVPRPGFLAWNMQTSDDGKMAIVQIVAADRNAFAAILADTRPEIKVFQIGKDSPATIQAEMQKYRKDFNLATFEVPVQ